MSIFNYKAELVSQSETDVIYKFYPDYIGQENVSGEFRISFGNWKSTIILTTKIEECDSFSCNERPVSALTYKIKKHFEEDGNFPKVEYWNA